MVQSGKNKAGMQPEGENFSNILGAFSNAFPTNVRATSEIGPPQGLTCIFNGGSHRDKMINHIDRNYKPPSTNSHTHIRIHNSGQILLYYSVIINKSDGAVKGYYRSRMNGRTMIE